MKSSGSKAVDFIGKLNISGNVIPNEWYRTIVKEDGKPYLLAIILLSEFVYWYRPYEKRDEQTGKTMGMQKRFAEDKLQKSYPALAEKFGVSRRTVMAAVHFLCELGVITRETRTVSDGDGGLYGNTLYIEVVPEVLYKLTYPNEKEEEKGQETAQEVHLKMQEEKGQVETAPPYTKKCTRGHTENDAPPYTKNCISPYTKKRTTYTKNTDTENIISSSSSPQDGKTEEEDEILKLKLNYERIREKYPGTAEEVFRVIRQLPCMERMVLRERDMETVCENVCRHADRIRMPSNYIRSCIDNMLAGQRMAKAQEIRHPAPGKNAFRTQTERAYDFEALERELLGN